ncbi:uncharacterized protein LOC129253140 [Anastrepha obliqua]|uniref:uncharacterized protein LOC129253140 n=1 Tax=Anastrepha obliqua TaxID=95512 RepID=UPI0024099783|nr:uncharacterized protein LOC129253140 [Anastrepha obliqua]
MDASRQTYSEANSTGVSMYLSFDSSISSAAYKTLEATTNDLSMLFDADRDEETVENSQELNQNSTLEALDSHLKYLESVKDMDKFSQLSVVPKRVLQEYNVVSSTPTKEQLLRSVEIVRGSSAERCLDLKYAFMAIDEKNKSNLASDKENVLPLNGVTVLSDEKPNVSAITTKEQITSVVEEKPINKNVGEDTTTNGDETKKVEDDGKNAVSIENKAEGDKKVKAPIEKKAINKRISMVKKPSCEPNLLTNRPSRIATNSNKRLSVNNVGIKTDIDKEISSEIPKLLNRVLKFTEATIADDNKKTTAALDKRKSILSNTKGRSSMLPTNVTQAGKRPFAFTQRMSVLVKTTLNSPARKISRYSVVPPGQQNRKSVAPNVLLHPNRKSMLPVGIVQPSKGGPNAKIQTKPITESIKCVPANRKSIYPIDKPNIDSHKTTSASTLARFNTKPRPSVVGKNDTSFICNVCGRKFSIKSLLDAHKRSHEGDGLPAFVKKSTTSISNNAAALSQTNGVNKCKYCDKKFVLLRTLHIHLLQNCSKIPSNEKRKLKFHEMDHQEKAQLPAFFHTNSYNGKINSQAQTGSTPNAPSQRSHSDLSSISVSSLDSTNDKKALAEITMIANTATSAVDGLVPEMAAPSARMVKKTTAHAGVHRTPNKSIICHICKMSFKCIMDNVQHNMTVHFQNTENKKSESNA